MAVIAAENKKVQSRILSMNRIESAAIQLFVKKGYANTNIDEIARKCNLTKGAIYHYYKGKQGVLLSILDRIENDFMVSIANAAEEQHASPRQRLLGIFNAHARHAATNPDDFMLLVVVSMEFSRGKGEVSKRINSIYDQLIDAFMGVIREGRESGEFIPIIPDRELAQTIVGGYSGNVLEWYRSGCDPDVGRALVKGLRTMVLQVVVKNQ